MWFSIPLWQRVMGALVLGIIVGLLMGPDAQALKWIGDIFIRAIKMLVVPLIFFSLVSGVAAIGDMRKMGSVGGRALGLFMLTSLLAVTLGLVLGNLVDPGAGIIAPPIDNSVPLTVAPSVTEMIVAIVPDNPVASMAKAEVLQLIVFAVLFGIGIVMAGEPAAGLKRAIDAGALVMQKVTMIVMELAPFGVFALIAWVAGTMGIDALLGLGKLVGTLYFGCFVMILVVYAGIVRFGARLPVIPFFKVIGDAQAVAFSTASSSATLPVTMRCVQQNIGVSHSTSSFILSLGATVNMDGTALYLGLAAVFGATIFGVDLSIADYVTIALLSTLASIGAAGIPGAGLIMMTLVFSAVDIPLETIGIVAGVDRIMDMMRTMTNITGDSAVTTAVASSMGDVDRSKLVPGEAV